MLGRRCSVSKPIGNSTVSVVVEALESAWVIKNIHWEGSDHRPPDKQSFDSADDALHEGLRLAAKALGLNSGGHSAFSNSVV